MRLRINKVQILYLFIIIAFLNAVLRTSPTSNLTLFRVLLPVSVLLIASISKRIMNIVIGWGIIIILLSFTQYVLCTSFFYPQIDTFSLGHQLQYLFHIFSIDILFGLILCLKRLQGKCFYDSFIHFLSVMAKAFIIVYIIYLLTGNAPESFLLFGNINDFGCIITVGAGAILCDRFEKGLNKIVWCLLIVSLLYYNDSKLALLGAIVEIFLFIALSPSSSKEISNEKRKSRWIWKRLLTLLVIVLAILLLEISPMINGYSLRGITIEPIRLIMSGTLFNESRTSITYRVNCIIILISILIRTLGLGVGTGNSGLILKALVPDPYGTFVKYGTLSSHIWWLELMTDFGLIFIIPAIIMFFKQIILFFRSETMNRLVVFKLVILISFPIWSMSSSGLYTEYFSLASIIIALMIDKGIKNREKELINNYE